MKSKNGTGRTGATERIDVAENQFSPARLARRERIRQVLSDLKPKIPQPGAVTLNVSGNLNIFLGAERPAAKPVRRQS
jgi:hypothetical protein